MWPASILSAIQCFDEERRDSPRQVINEVAELLIPIEEMKLPCVVVNISASGAKITCDAIPPSGTKVVVIFKGGFSIQAVTTRYEQGELGLTFNAPAVE